MARIAALLLVVGNGCRLAEPRGVWTNCVWFASTVTAALAVLTVNSPCGILRTATVISAAVTFICLECGLIGLIREVRQWPDD